MIYTIKTKYVDYELKEKLYKYSLTKIAQLSGLDRTYISKLKHDRDVAPYETYLKIKKAIAKLEVSQEPKK